MVSPGPMGGARHRLAQLLVACLVAVLAALLVGPPAPGLADDQPAADTVMGTSQGGEPLVVHHLGTGKTRLFILGGQHGGPEANTVELTQWLKAYFQEHPDDIPPGVGVDVLTPANPDGMA